MGKTTLVLQIPSRSKVTGMVTWGAVELTPWHVAQERPEAFTGATFWGITMIFNPTLCLNNIMLLKVL